MTLTFTSNPIGAGTTASSRISSCLKIRSTWWLPIAAGVPLRTVSYRAGHAQTSTTANIYSHAIRTADEMAADVLDDILTPASVRRSIG
ncbi:MAG: hypothetical protein GX111_11515 [Clostridiales bacterium]|nr:hypothetical protein [Clostridiales bacterium]